MEPEITIQEIVERLDKLEQELYYLDRDSVKHWELENNN